MLNDSWAGQNPKGVVVPIEEEEGKQIVNICRQTQQQYISY